MEQTKKPNKISEIVRLQRMLKKWKKLANAPKPPPVSTHTNTTISKSNSSNNLNSSTSKSIKFLKKTLSFSDRDYNSSTVSNANNNDVVPKGYLAVCVGKELKRFIIPTEYLAHQAFGILLREAEDEFGFQQEGVLKIPCDVPFFEKIVKMVQENREVLFLHDPSSNCFVSDDLMNTSSSNGCYSPDQSSCELTSTPHHPQLCR